MEELRESSGLCYDIKRVLGVEENHHPLDRSWREAAGAKYGKISP
jgi:hypothetical protein